MPRTVHATSATEAQFCLPVNLLLVALKVISLVMPDILVGNPPSSWFWPCNKSVCPVDPSALKASLGTRLVIFVTYPSPAVMPGV